MDRSVRERWSIFIGKWTEKDKARCGQREKMEKDIRK